MLLNRNDSMLLLIDVQEKLMPFILNKEQCVKKISWLLKLATRLEVPVLTSEQYPKGLGPTIAELKNYINSSEIMAKVHFSCASSPGFLSHLCTYQKKQLILIGIETHVCIMQTALELKNENYEVFVVVDAVGSRFEIDNRYGLKRMKQAGIHLITSEMVFFEWLRQSDYLNFKNLSKEFLQSE